MDPQQWVSRSIQIIDLLSGASAQQLEEILEDINDLLTAQLEEEA